MNIDFNKLPETLEEYHLALGYISYSTGKQLIDLCADICDKNRGVLNIGDMIRSISISGDKQNG